MAAVIPPASGKLVSPALTGDIIGGAAATFALPPDTYQTRFGEAQFDLLEGQYRGLYTK